MAEQKTCFKRGVSRVIAEAPTSHEQIMIFYPTLMLSTHQELSLGVAKGGSLGAIVTQYVWAKLVKAMTFLSWRLP